MSFLSGLGVYRAFCEFIIEGCEFCEFIRMVWEFIDQFCEFIRMVCEFIDQFVSLLELFVSLL